MQEKTLQPKVSVLLSTSFCWRCFHKMSREMSTFFFLTYDQKGSVSNPVSLTSRRWETWKWKRHSNSKEAASNVTMLDPIKSAVSAEWENYIRKAAHHGGRKQNTRLFSFSFWIAEQMWAMGSYWKTQKKVLKIFQNNKWGSKRGNFIQSCLFATTYCVVLSSSISRLCVYAIILVNEFQRLPPNTHINFYIWLIFPSNQMNSSQAHLQ